MQTGNNILKKYIYLSLDNFCGQSGLGQYESFQIRFCSRPDAYKTLHTPYVYFLVRTFLQRMLPQTLDILTEALRQDKVIPVHALKTYTPRRYKSTNS